MDDGMNNEIKNEMNKKYPPILIVDDDEVDRYVLKRLVKASGLDLTIFEKIDGKEALDFFEDYEENKRLHPDSYPPILIFLDINMPRVNGIEFLEKFSHLRKLIEIDSCVIIMFSSSEREEDKKKIMAYDFVKDYVVKGTLTAEELKTKILAVTLKHQ
ncbi:response regulator [Psychromonas arctica]|uniref:Response regulator n=1 Tax=Psychromonas arctica TaxID=168275 RepID=A0ABU9HCQ0_9GAMM